MTILVIAPHADDEVLGMGGTIKRFTSQGKRVIVAVLTGHGEQPHPIWNERHWDGVREECLSASKCLGVDEVIFRNLPAACLDDVPAWRVNQVVDQLIREYGPTEIYSPFAYDLHKDHSVISYAISVASRPYLGVASCVKRVLAYETLSETHLAHPYMAPAFQPNVFVNIEKTLTSKLDAMKAYGSQLQLDNSPRSIAALKSLAVLRGTHIGCEAAEGFVLLGEYQR